MNRKYLSDIFSTCVGKLSFSPVYWLVLPQSSNARSIILYGLGKASITLAIILFHNSVKKEHVRQDRIRKLLKFDPELSIESLNTADTTKCPRDGQRNTVNCLQALN